MKKIALLIIIIIFTSCANKQISSKINNQNIHTFLDSWHHAAAVADENIFFRAFTQDAIYIGTDPTEHWSAQEFKELFKPVFKKESAWDFKPYNRHIFYSKDGNTIWFDELLDTWMGVCRGSGVLLKENGKWKIAHYHLSVSVPNDIIQPYLKILEDNSKESL